MTGLPNGSTATAEVEVLPVVLPRSLSHCSAPELLSLARKASWLPVSGWPAMLACTEPVT